MLCPTCANPMRHLDGYAFWCDRCGTAKVQGAARHLTPTLAAALAAERERAGAAEAQYHVCRQALQEAELEAHAAMADATALRAALVAALNTMRTAQADIENVGGRRCAEATFFNAPIRKARTALAQLDATKGKP